MAQFKRNLFGTSYFGKSYAFTGEYYTRILNVEEAFSGHVDVSLKVDLPNTKYLPNDTSIFTYQQKWEIQSNNKIKSTGTSPLSAFVCASKIEFDFDSTSVGSMQINIEDDFGKTIYTTTFDSNTNKKFTYYSEFRNLWVTIIPSSASSPIVLNALNARTSSIAVELLSHEEYISQDPNDLNTTTKITFPLNLEVDSNGYIHGLTETAQVNKKAVGLRIILASSESRQEASPVVDTIKLSSGDMSKFSEKGSWYAAINMNNVAEDKGVQFKRTKRLDFSVKQNSFTSDLNWMEEYLEIRSASKDLVVAGDSSIPTDLDLMSSYYWSPETATYRTYNNNVYDRLSLGHNHNGSFTENKEYGTILLGPFSKEIFPYINSTLTHWQKLVSAYSFPTDTNGTYLKIQVWNTNKIDQFLPVYEKSLTRNNMNPEIILELAQHYEEIYIGLVFYSTVKTQSPVFDFLNISYELKYDKIINYNSKISGLDNMFTDIQYPEAPEGTKLLHTINTSSFSVPSNAINKKYTLKYQPKYPNQQFVYFGNQESVELANPNQQGDISTIRVFSRVTPETPRASVFTVPSDRLYWHFQYDGGTVGYPHTTEKEIGTAFTPSLIQNKNYRFAIINGWPNESLTLFSNLSWEEIAEITSSNVDVLKDLNPNIILYNNLIQKDTVIQLENKTKNKNVNFVFESNNRMITEKSVWNGQQENDTLLARAVAANDNVIDWVSEERLFAGIINPNNQEESYVRTQSLGLGAEVSDRIIQHTDNQPINYYDLAQRERVNLADLMLANNLLHQYSNAKDIYVESGESIIIPAPPSLPEIPSNVFYDSENPYFIEVIPNSIIKSYDGIPILDNYLIAGSDDELPVQYTTIESEVKEHVLTRGDFAHGVDVLPYANIERIISIRNNVNGVTYTPYTKGGTTESGDYYLENGMINWAPNHVGSKEPSTGHTYTVRFTNNIIDSLKIIYTSDYYEKLSYNKLWRSKEIKEITAVVSPDQDVWLDLPNKEDYSDYQDHINKVDYVIEDSDLWVKSSLEETQNGPKIKLSFEGKDPKRNWYPTINKGFYYINDQEYYLYSEPIQHHFGPESIPVIENVYYNSNGLHMLAKNYTEYISNGDFKHGDMTGWIHNANQTQLLEDVKEGFYVVLSSDNIHENFVSFKQTLGEIPAGAILSIRLSNPMDGIVRIRIADTQEFALQPNNEWQSYELVIEESIPANSELSIETATQLNIASVSIKD